MNNLLKQIDNLLNRITMYRLMLYYLTILYSLAVVFSFFKILPYNFIDLLSSGMYLVLVCFVFNQIFAKVFKNSPNYESQLITGMILALIVGPLPILSNLIFLTLLGVISMGSKYIVAYKKQHIFNPAAFSVVITAIAMGLGASWWIGDKIMMPFILIGGLLMIRKMRRFSMILSFVISLSIFVILFSFSKTGIQGILVLLQATFLSPPLLFFTFIMLTEPITSPSDRKYRIYFGIFTGIIYVLLTQFAGSLFYTLELSLLLANIAFRLVRFSEKYSLQLLEKKEIANSIWEFVFEPTKPISFTAGQYLEWSLAHPHTDSRGNRRYFTIASSPTEKNVKLAVKIPEKASSYKSALNNLGPGSEIYATNLEGEFVLTSDKTQKYVFIAGGIGVTPYRSIIQYLVDKKTNASITLFYIAKTDDEFAYKELFKSAERYGVKTVYIVSENPPIGWTGEVGRLSEEMIKKYVPDFESNLFYISGPQPMVMAYEELLQKMGQGKIKYKADFFPGYEETYLK